MEKENKVKEEEKKEKKVEVELNNRRYRIPEHMLEDAEKLGATSIKKTIKNPPKELKLPGSTKELSDLERENILLKERLAELTSALPDMKSEIDVVKEKLTKLDIKFHPKTGLDKLKLKLEEAEKK